MTPAPLPHPPAVRRWPRRGLVSWFVAVLLVAVLTLVAFVAAVVPSAPTVADLREAQAAEPSTLLAVDGEVLASFGRGQQENVGLDRISRHVVQALIATEDRRFYEHRGVDWRRTAGALLSSLSGDVQGGSTLTQQLARNMFPEEIGRSRTATRKIKETITALRIERVYSKEQILETYLNTVPFLYNVVGIEMAARTYYDKPAAELNELESATLVGMLKGTYYYNPVIYPERAQKRRNLVLSQMVRAGVLTPERFEVMKDAPLGVSLNRQTEDLGAAPHFAAHARKWLLEWAQAHDYDLYRDGLVVQTTLDAQLQRAATLAVERQAALLQQVADVEWSRPAMHPVSGDPEAYVRASKRAAPFAHFWATHQTLFTAFVQETPEFKKAVAGGASAEAAIRQLGADPKFVARLRADKSRLEAGFLAMDPESGEIKAWVGSREFARDQFDHVAQAERQPGSTFKPVVYGAALEQGLQPDHTFIDGPVEIPLGDGTVWKPTDMGGASGLPMTLREGLALSKNTITAQVMQEIGAPTTVRFAKSLGIDQSKLDPVPSLALGTSPVTLLELVTAYSTIANEGQHRQPLFISRIKDRHGKPLAEFHNDNRRVMSRESAVDLIDMLRGVVNRGTATQVKTRFGLVADVAGKTGTTQNNTDGWFVLMHPKLVAGAWVGFNDARVTMRSDYWGQGGHNAILLVGDFFRRALKSKRIDANATFPPPFRPAPAASAPEAGALLPADHWATPPEASTTEEAPLTGPGVLTGQDGQPIVIGDPASAPPPSASAPASAPR